MKMSLWIGFQQRKWTTITTSWLVLVVICFSGSCTGFAPPNRCSKIHSKWQRRIAPHPRVPKSVCFMNFGLMPPPEKTVEEKKTGVRFKDLVLDSPGEDEESDAPQAAWNMLTTSADPNNVQDMERWVGKEGDGWERNILPLGIAAVLGGAAVLVHHGMDIENLSTQASTTVSAIMENPTGFLENAVDSIQSMGNLGLLYFGAIYTVAEILAIPAIPLTASAGYLFGVTQGTAVVLVCASVAAAVSFIIGRTLLRGYVEGVLEDSPVMRKIDKAIGKEGFKLMLLLRLSPIFPFALSNYLYGATSVRFWPYFFGTMLGFTPGTIAYVYTGEVGKALTLGVGAQPWYVYALAFAGLGAFLKVGSDVANNIIQELQDEEQL